MFRINTNVTALESRESLRQTIAMQQQSINRITSGKRLLTGGDDAAALAFANSLRSEQAVLGQGVRNANDGLSALQTLDGGVSNIGRLLDRARTLATQSASGTFSGDRRGLDREFSSLISEIDRQAQAVGLVTGDALARSLAVYVGGGRAANGISSTANGSAGVDLSAAAVDARSLGLRGVQAQGISTSDLGPASATSVANILSNATNQASLTTAGFTELYFRGPGFGDRNQIRVTTSLAGVTDIDTLVANSNAAIEAAGDSPTAAATSFRNAGIRAAVVTDAAGRKSLSFTSASTAFQVAAGDRMANALLGNVKTASNPAGRGLTNTVTGGSATAVAGTPFGAAGAGTIGLHFRGASLPWPAAVSLQVTATTTIEEALADLGTAIRSEASLQGAGLTLASAEAGQPLVFSLSRGERFEVRVAGDVQNRLGLGSFRGSTGAGGTTQYASLTGVAGTFAAIPQTLEFSIADGATESIAVTPATSGISGATTALNAAFAGNATLAAAGLRATNNGTVITIASTSGSRFRMAALGATDVFGFNSPGAASTADTAEIQAGNTEVNFFLSAGARQTDLLSFSPIRNGDDDQTITISATDASEAIQSLALVLRNDATLARGGLDDVINFVNLSLQQANNPTLRQIVAVKDKASAAGAEGIRFASTLDRFEVAISTNKSGAGIGSQGTVVRAATVGTGSTSSIESEAAAARTVTALSDAVSRLGAAQAVIGRGQNQFTFAVNLAQSQLTTLAASESLIRDADLAQETASLARARILLEAGIAALAQAYTAPRQVLSLLRDG